MERNVAALGRDRDGKLHSEGLRLRVKGMLPRDERARFFVGLNVEFGYDAPHLSEDRHNLGLHGILGSRDGRWLVSVNPILAWVLKGRNKSGEADFESGFKVLREAGEGWSFGVEHYGGYGRLGEFSPRREQDQMLYFVAEREGRSFRVNLRSRRAPDAGFGPAGLQGDFLHPLPIRMSRQG